MLTPKSTNEGLDENSSGGGCGLGGPQTTYKAMWRRLNVFVTDKSMLGKAGKGVFWGGGADKQGGGGGVGKLPRRGEAAGIAYELRVADVRDIQAICKPSIKLVPEAVLDPSLPQPLNLAVPSPSAPRLSYFALLVFFWLFFPFVLTHQR